MRRGLIIVGREVPDGGIIDRVMEEVLDELVRPILTRLQAQHGAEALRAIDGQCLIWLGELTPDPTSWNCAIAPVEAAICNYLGVQGNSEITELAEQSESLGTVVGCAAVLARASAVSFTTMAISELRGQPMQYRTTVLAPMSNRYAARRREFEALLSEPVITAIQRLRQHNWPETKSLEYIARPCNIGSVDDPTSPSDPSPPEVREIEEFNAELRDVLACWRGKLQERLGRVAGKRLETLEEQRRFARALNFALDRLQAAISIGDGNLYRLIVTPNRSGRTGRFQLQSNTPGGRYGFRSIPPLDRLNIVQHEGHRPGGGYRTREATKSKSSDSFEVK